MEVSIQTQKKKRTQQPPPSQPERQQAQQYGPSQQQQKDRKIKKLTQVNRELIQRLKQQNDDLTKKINKQKMKPSRSLSVKSSPKGGKQIESTKKQLMNAYKQIDMYKSVLTNLKAKQISIDSVDKINQLENKIKYEEGIIDQLQKQIKYLGSIKEQQQKQLKIFENQDVKNSVAELEKQVNSLKQKIKLLKKNSQKRDDVEKKQHAYQIQLERALRKLNDQYYPGKMQQKKGNNGQEMQSDLSQKQWQTAKNQLAELRKSHQQNQKKIDNIIRQKNKQLKSAQQNELKIKQKSRKLQTLKNKLTELSKLVTVRESTMERKGLKQEAPLGQGNGHHQMEQEKLSPKQKAEKKAQQSREVKKWMIPQGYCLEKGKILPDSIFFSDKALLKQAKKTKITEINVWHNNEQIPCLLQFNYQNQNSDQVQGIQPVPNASSSLELVVFKMKEGDYLHKIKGFFLDGEMIGIHFISKFGKEFTVESQNAKSEGELFTFEPRPNEIPSCVFGAYVRKASDEVRICHMGFQFMTDW